MTKVNEVNPPEILINTEDVEILDPRFGRIHTFGDYYTQRNKSIKLRYSYIICDLEEDGAGYNRLMEFKKTLIVSKPRGRQLVKSFMSLFLEKNYEEANLGNEVFAVA